MIRFLQTPSRAKKIVLSGLLLLICAAMVITLVPGGFLGDTFGLGGPGQGVLAKVGDQEVTAFEAQQVARNMVRQQFPKGAPEQLMPFFLQRAVQYLVQQKAMLTEAERLGLRVTDAELANFLQHGQFGPVLFPNGQFVGQEAYERFIEQNFNYTVPQFEKALKADLVMGKLRNVVLGGVTVSDSALRQEYIRRNTKVKFDYAVLTLDDVSKSLKPSDAELKAFYDKNKGNYANSIPEKRKVQYVFINAANLKNTAQVTPEDLKNYYNQHMDEFRVADEVKVRHILVKTPAPGPDGKADQKAVDAARAKAENLLKSVKSGGNFAEVAKKNSDDPGSAAKGGELGWIQRGQTVPEFEKSAFSLKPNEISGLVQSSFGFHIIQVQEKHTPRVKPLEEVKAQIEPSVLNQKASKQIEALANTVQSQAKTSNLQAAAQKNGLELMASPLVTRNDSVPAVGNSPEFMNAVFNARPKDAPQIAGLPNGFAVYQVLEVQPPATPAFEEIKAKVDEDFRRDRGAEVLSQKVRQLADRARAEHNLRKAAAEVGAVVKTSDLVSRDQQVQELGSMSDAASLVFDLKPGEISSPFQTARGGAVAALVERQEPGPADFAAQKDQLRATLIEKKRDEMLGLFLDNLRARMEKEKKIKFNEAELKRLIPQQAS